MFMPEIAKSLRHYGPKKNQTFECWNDDGEPGRTGPMLVTVGRLLQAVKKKHIELSEEDARFLQVLDAFVRPTSAWKTPLVRVIANSIIIDKDKPFEVRLCVGVFVVVLLLVFGWCWLLLLLLIDVGCYRCWCCLMFLFVGVVGVFWL
jgi:hypothetical protein